MGHTDERFVSKGGFGVGEYGSVTNVISSAGQVELASAVPATALAEEAGFEKTISLYAATGALTVGKPVYISGYSSLAAPEVSLAKADDRTKAAQFVITSAATAANKPVSVATVADVASNSTLALGTILYLSATAKGVLVATAPTVMFAQPIGMVTKVATTGLTDGTMKCYPGYSKAVNPAST